MNEAMARVVTAGVGQDDRARLQRDTVMRFSAAWDTGDVGALLDLMSDEPIYRGSTGPNPGTEFIGRDAVREAFERMAGPNRGSVPEESEPEAEPEMHFFGNRALVSWTLTLPGADSEVDGVDVFTFTDDGRIAVKDAYRKAFG